MNKHELKEAHHHRIFVRHLLRNLSVGIFLILISLAIGVAGYSYFEQMSLLDAYMNASMILSGMGPVKEINTDIGKFFAGTYALFSGIIFLLIIAFIFAPLFIVL